MHEGNRLAVEEWAAATERGDLDPSADCAEEQS